MTARAVLLGTAVCLCAARVGAAPPEARKLAADSLCHSALSLGHLPKNQALGWAPRIRVLLEQAERLWPDHVEVNRQLFELYQHCGEPRRAARAGRRYLMARPDDYAVGVGWIRLCQAGLDRAEDRISALRDIASERRLDGAIRAAASAELAGIYMRQGLRDEAVKECGRALKLDPSEPEAISIRARLAAGRTEADRLADVLALFRADPASPRSAWAVARTLQALGLYDEALEYYKHADLMARVRVLSANDFAQFVVDYCNAMLDAGKAEAAVVRFEPIARRYRGRLLPLQALMWEAYRTLGKSEPAKTALETMEQTYNRRWADRQRLTGPELAEIAWFHVVFSPDPARALKVAQEALKKAPDDPFVRRVMGSAELAAGKTAEGIRRLRPLVANDAFAAVSLVRHFVSADQRGEAQKLVAAAVATGRPRSGMAWRELRRTIEENKLALPAGPDRARLKGILGKEGTSTFEMGKAPEKFLALKLTSVRAKVRPGEPVVVRIELENISAQSVPLGERGVLKPTVFLGVAVKGEASRRWDFPHLLSAELPAPRYLAPGHGAALSLRVDVGEVERVLMTHPLESLTITVTPMLDPIWLGRKLYSSSPGIKAAPVIIQREPLFGLSGGAGAARAALGRIVQDLRRGDLTARMRAARQTAALLAHVRATELGKARPLLPGVLNKPVLLSMTGAFLRDGTPLVRAEMLSALGFVPLEEPIIALTAPCVQDASGLVRGRLIELLAGQRTRGHETLLKLYRRDSDRFVRDMAAAVSGPAARPACGPGRE